MSDEPDPVLSLAEARARAEARAASAQAQAQQQGRRKPDAQPWLTWTVIGLNVAVWLVMVGLGVHFYQPSGRILFEWGGNLGLVTAEGQWWRLLTAMFIHAGILHLAFNLYFAWVIGRVCETIYGPAAYALVYLGSGLIASLTSAIVQPGVVSVGASGALFGVFGAFLGFTVRRRDVLPPEFVSNVRKNALVLIGINLAIGFAVPGIDIAAHIGGLVAGGAIGYVIARLTEQPATTSKQAKAIRMRAVAMTAAMTVAVIVAMGFGAAARIGAL